MKQYVVDGESKLMQALQMSPALFTSDSSSLRHCDDVCVFAGGVIMCRCDCDGLNGSIILMRTLSWHVILW